MDAESGELFLRDEMKGSWMVHAPFSCSELIPNEPEKPLQDWVEDPNCTLTDSESEDVLHVINPNQVFDSDPPADPSSESDSGISEEVGSPVAMVTAPTTKPAAATVYQVVYDITGPEPGHGNVVSIELGEWSSQVMMSDSCIVNELPVVSVPPEDHQNMLFPELHLTEEEQKLLTEEGVSLPSNLPLTKAEERILKKVRRKIRNKQSAQDSRRRRKEYIDGLESRAAACSAQNKELERTVEQLEKRNMSLLAQLGQLQSLIKHTVSKGAQTSTCLLIILVSLSLIILPSFSPFSRRLSAGDDDRPIGVISRNILTDTSSSQTVDANVPTVRSDSSPPLSELGQSGRPKSSAVFQEPIKQLKNTAVDVESSQSGNSSAVVDGQTETMAKRGSHDSTKLAHADEM